MWAKHAAEVRVHPLSSKFQLVNPLAELLPGGLTLLLPPRGHVQLHTCSRVKKLVMGTQLFGDCSEDIHVLDNGPTPPLAPKLNKSNQSSLSELCSL